MYHMYAQKQNMSKTASASAADARFCASSSNTLPVMMDAIILASIILFTILGEISIIIIVSLLILVVKNVKSRLTGTLVEPL